MKNKKLSPSEKAALEAAINERRNAFIKRYENGGLNEFEKLSLYCILNLGKRVLVRS